VPGWLPTVRLAKRDGNGFPVILVVREASRQLLGVQNVRPRLFLFANWLSGPLETGCLCPGDA